MRIKQALGIFAAGLFVGGAFATTIPDAREGDLVYRYEDHDHGTGFAGVAHVDALSERDVLASCGCDGREMCCKLHGKAACCVGRDVEDRSFVERDDRASCGCDGREMCCKVHGKPACCVNLRAKSLPSSAYPPPPEVSQASAYTDMVIITIVITPSGYDESTATKTSTGRAEISTTHKYSIITTNGRDESDTSSDSTQTLANTTITWSDGSRVSPTISQSLASSIATTTFDQLSQTVVTTTVPATSTPMGPTCDANGVCVLSPSCSVSFPGYISCADDNEYSRSTTSILASTGVLSTTVTASMTGVSSSFDGKNAAGASPTTTVTASNATAMPAPPSGCSTVHPQDFRLGIMPMPEDASCPHEADNPADLNHVMHIADGTLWNQKQQVGYIAQNGELTFSAAVPTDAISSAGWSACEDGWLALGDDTLFCSCSNGDNAYNVYHALAACGRRFCLGAQLSIMLAVSSSPATAGPSESVVSITTTVSTLPSAPGPVVGPTQTSNAAISEDGKCGASVNQTCMGSSFGDCCSIHGWCGNSTDYCAVGNCIVDGEYGACSLTDQASVHKRFKSNVERDTDILGRQNNLGPTCGYPDNTCFNNPAGYCCSVYGWCGNGPEYCGSLSCDGDWGYCSAGDQSNSTVHLINNRTLEARLARRNDMEVVSTVVATVVVATSIVTASSGDGHGGSTTSTTTITTTHTTNVTLTDPINTLITSIGPANTTLPQINNTAIDTNSYLNISAFTATDLTLLPSSAPDAASFSLRSSSHHETVTSTQVIRPSVTETRSGTGNTAFTAAVTSDLAGNHSSAGFKAVEMDGSYLPMLAGLGPTGVFGLALML